MEVGGWIELGEVGRVLVLGLGAGGRVRTSCK